VENALRAALRAGLALVFGVAVANAQEMKAPHISRADADWNAVAVELRALAPLQVRALSAETDAETPPEVPAPLAALNRLTGERFAKIADSPVPVLLPFDTEAFLRDRTAGAAAESAGNAYLFGFESTPFFQTGPGGYDAVVSARAQDMKELGIAYAERIFIQISGAAVLYEIAEPHGMIGWPVTGGIDADFPGIKRMFLENYVRYTFVRYGVPYVVSIECFDGPSRFRKIACRDADKVAIRVLKSLRLAGGQSQKAPQAPVPGTIERPAAQSILFTYHPPGDLPRYGTRGKGGAADYTVYSKMRFPIADGPAFANTQFARGEWAPQNYAYPWRDNFCENRGFYVGQCPGGLGHQGQDIRPASCDQRGPGGRCEPYHHEVVAARDGIVMRAPGQMALYVVVNAQNERIRFRYLHMLPKQLDADGMVGGRAVKEGEVIGKVGNYWYREGATTYHLHFDIQVPTKYGWVFVNPYMTLVAAYERLIQARGRELRDDVPTASIATAAKPVIAPAPPPPAAAPAPPPPVAEPPPPVTEAPTTMAAKPTETTVESPAPTRIEVPSDARLDDPTPVPASVPAAHDGDSNSVEQDSIGTGQPVKLRAVGRGVPRAGGRTWHFRHDLHEGDEQP
jgi:murein DD-endopeptidase MepM/ murein hydrolase activator NlpD